MGDLRKFTPEELSFIRAHLQDNPAALSLKYHGSNTNNTHLIHQIQARQKLRKKLPEWTANEQVRFPVGLPLEQASSEATARLKASLISGDYLLDLTGGLGVDAYYLSQSFKQTTYAEKQALLAEHARYNFQILGADIEVIHCDAREILDRSEADFLYLDPHRRGDSNRKQILLSEHEPNVLELLPQLTSSGRKTLLKTSPMLDIQAAIHLLPSVSEVWVISLGNDCKEVLYLLDQESATPALIRTWNLVQTNQQYFETALNKEKRETIITPPSAYLYEPNSAIFKAGIQDELALHFKLGKLAVNSHLYTGSQAVINFPGKAYMVKRVCKAWDKSLKGGRYNLVNRNFPEKAMVIEQKMKFKPSDHHYILATTLADGRSVFIESLLINSCRS